MPIKFMVLIPPEFQFISSTFAFGSGLTNDPFALVMAYVDVLDDSNVGVENVQIQWSTSPNVLTGTVGEVVFYKDPGSEEPFKPPVLADMINGLPCTLTDADGRAFVWITSTNSHVFNLAATMIGSQSSIEKTVIFGTMATQSNPFFTAPDVMGDLRSDGLHTPIGAAYFDVQIPTDSIPQAHQPDPTGNVMIGIAHYTDYFSGGNGFEYTIVDVPYVARWSDLTSNPIVSLPLAGLIDPTDAAHNKPPSHDLSRRNGVFYIPQAAGGSVLGTRAGLSNMTAFDLATPLKNQPPYLTDAQRQLPEVTLTPDPGTGYITQNTITTLPGGGLQLTIEALTEHPELDGEDIDFILYINGFRGGTEIGKHAHPVIPDKSHSTIQASSTQSVSIVIDYAWLTGFSVSASGRIGRTWFDYKVGKGASALYSTYPNGWPMDT
ncbi:hypothetical protein C5748_25515 [Phyllobacterium phragmitis]|uniref:Uncharacterized protein n=1 Tax=Phyllobacterium phragmitis TaxID=2670329 RepID=A0A2S9IJJ0_9HYPH|nr:hypothetical protein C5748_25515 [Phyllobacterium phragmitis]